MAGGIIGTIAGSLLGPLIPSINTIVERLVPDPIKQQQIQAELTRELLSREAEISRAVAEAAKAQNEVNLAEAQSGNRFAANWRPFIGWVCGVGCAYSFVLQPFLAWGTTMTGAAIGANIPSPPVMNTEVIMGLVTGLLGLGTLRTVEKTSGVVTPEPNPIRKPLAVRR